MAFLTLRRGRRDQPTALQSSSNSYKSMSRSVLKKIRPLLLDDEREFRDTDSSLPPSYPSYSTWQEDLLVVNANLLVWRGRTRLILYLLGPNESLIPEYLGQKIAEGMRQRLMGERF